MSQRRRRGTTRGTAVFDDLAAVAQRGRAYGRAYADEHGEPVMLMSTVDETAEELCACPAFLEDMGLMTWWELNGGAVADAVARVGEDLRRGRYSSGI